MTQSTESPPAETNGSPISLEPDQRTLRPISPSSGGSDNDGGERPVREKLKKASIAGLSERAGATEVEPNIEKSEVETPLVDAGKTQEDNTQETKSQSDTTQADAAAGRGRLPRKRSFDDLQKDSPVTPDGKATESATHRGNHKRMRSRDVSGNSDSSDDKTAREQVEAVAEEEDDELARLSPGGAGVMVEAPSEEEGSLGGDRSPKRKRSRDQFDKDHSSSDDGSIEDKEHEDAIKEDVPVPDEVSMAPSAAAAGKGEPEKKRPRDKTPEDLAAEDDRDKTASAGSKPLIDEATNSGQSHDEKPAGDKATTTPFDTLPQPKSPALKPDTSSDKPPLTSSSAFASSGLAAFASKSAFGALSSSGTSSGFGSFGAKKSTGSTGGFGSASGFGGTTAFGATGTSGFGGLGANSGFGGGLGGSAFGGPKLGLSSFATPGGAKAKPLGSLSPIKALGKSDEDGNDDDSESGGIQDAGDGGDPKDSRFYEQQMETGEEGEETLFHCRARLFYFDKEWKERGTGNLKLNRQYIPAKDDETSDEADGDSDAEETTPDLEPKARLIMRTEGAQRVVLNTPIMKGMKFGTSGGGEPSGKQMTFTGIEDGKPATFLLRISREETVKGLYHQIRIIQDDLI